MTTAAAAEAAGAATHHQPSPKARGSSARCQICGVDLSNERIFFRRYRACPTHVHADSIMLDSSLSRFCQQCGRFHRLECFDGDKRSCREQLAQHAARRRYLYRLRHVGGTSEGGGTPTLSGGRTRSSSGGGGPKSSTTTTESDMEVEEGGVGGSGSGGAAAVLLGHLPRPTTKRLRTMLQQQLDRSASAAARPASTLPLPQPLSMFQHLPACWQSQAQVQAQCLGQQPSGLQPQSLLQLQATWQRADSGKSSCLQQPLFPWQRTDSSKSGQLPAMPYHRSDSGKSSTHQANLLEAAAAAAAAVAVTELGPPRSVAAEHAAQQWVQSATQLKPTPTPAPSQEQSQQITAELNQWVDEQLQRRQSPFKECQLLELPTKPRLARVGQAQGGTAQHGSQRGPGTRHGTFAVPPPPQHQPQRDVQQLWEQLWQATQPAELAVPPMPLVLQRQLKRVIWRPVPQRVRVLAPSLCAAVAAGQVPLGVAATQAQPLAFLMQLLQRAAGPLQPHELVRVLERVQPPPVLVAVPAAPATPPLLLPQLPQGPAADRLLTRYAPFL